MLFTITIADRDIRDYREAYTWLRWHSWLWPVLTALVVFVCVSNLWNHGTYTAYTVVYAILVIVTYFWGLASFSSRMKRAHEKSDPVSYTFTDTGFEYRSKVSHSETAWDAIDRTVETRRTLLLFYASSVFIMLPKRCFPDGTLSPFRAFLRERLSQNPH